MRWLPLTMAILASAVPALAELPPPASRVTAREIHHPGEPALRIGVPATATYVGGERFELYGVADCEVHVFVEAGPDRQVRRLYWIQFESYLPTAPDARYDYGEGGNRRIELWGRTTWVRAAFGPTSRTARPGSDTERVQTIIARAGYTPPEQMMNVRLVRLLDDPQGTGYGRRELMLIYAEDLALSGLTPEALTDDGRPNARWAALEEALIARSASAFQVEER
ncbi:MAG TPA: hypothetical protein VN231_13005 [Allosphingosinicella sp.]|nr:hypothetical protein [Allosphingosinicella sp.]